MKCDKKIRPFRNINETELACTVDDGGEGHSEHHAWLHDYAYPGSVSNIHWYEDDRRTFTGDFTECGAPFTMKMRLLSHTMPDFETTCLLPKDHRGEHVGHL